MGLRGAALLAHDPADEADQRVSRSLNRGVCPVKLFVVDELQPSRGKDLRFDFEQRTAGMAEMLAPFSERQSPLPFCNFTCDADGSAPKLRYQTKPLVRREPTGDLVDENDEIHRALKRDQILK